MKKTISIFIAIFLTSRLFAQDIKKYSGNFVNGLTEPGEATYSYYDDTKTKNPVKHGTFRYNVKSKDSHYRFYQTFTGGFNHDLKHADWSYRVNFRDYYRDKANFYSTGTVDLYANYNNGIPDGKWNYISVIKKRKKNSETLNEDWGRYGQEVKTIISLTFKKGLLVDSFLISTTDSIFVKGVFDENGYFDGPWTFKDKKTETIIEYVHGVQKAIQIKEISSEKLVQNNQNVNDQYLFKKNLAAKGNANELAKLDFRMLEVSVLADTLHLITSFLNNNIYNDNYFIYRYLPGDLLYYFNGVRFDINIKGGNYRFFQNQLTQGQQALLAEINSFENKIMRINDDAKRYPSNSETNKGAKKLIEINTQKVRKYACIATKSANELYLEKNLLKLLSECDSKFPIEIQTIAFISENEVLDYCKKQIIQLIKETESYFKTLKP